MRVRVDRYGRVVLPKDVRERLGIRENSELSLSVRGDEIVIRAQMGDLEERVNELVEFLRGSAPKPFAAEAEGEGDGKWLAWGYCLEKIGLELERGSKE